MPTYRSKLLKFIAYGIALAVTAGLSLRLFSPTQPEWLVVLGSIGIVALGAALSEMAPIFRHITPNPDDKANSGPTFVNEAPPGTVPRYGSRRWARMMYHNGLINIGELNEFYVRNPSDLRDPDR